MDKKQQEKIYELLKRGLKRVEGGEDLPAEWVRELFPPERREYELVYGGKATEEQILADTMAVPFQPASTFGQNGVDWHNKLIFGDNLQALKTLLKMKEDGELMNADGIPGVRLIYIDPPFSTKQDFRGSQDQKAYQDKIAGAEFLEFLRKRLILAHELLSNDGNFFVQLDYRKVHYLKVLLDEIFGENNFRSEIVWRRTFAGKTVSRKIPQNSDYILWYSKSDQYLFNPMTRELSESDIASFNKDDNDGRGKYGTVSLQKVAGPTPGTSYDYIDNLGRRWKCPAKGWRMVKEKLKALENDSRLYLTDKTIREKYYLNERLEKGKQIDNIWTDIGNLNRSQNEIVNYPTQKPESLIERIVNACSNSGDIVLDAFAGSGTTSVVAEKLKRRWIAIDCGKLAIYTIQKRMLNLRKNIGNTGEKITTKPFTLYNAGLYDFESLRQLPWESWRFFALKLFECRDEPHKISGFKMDGKRQGSSVHVFNHFDNKAGVSRDTIADIHASIGKSVGDRCFIIAPRGAFLFQEDFIEFDRIRYYALRIPYSYINELHRREFSALTQPSDEMAVNETVEAVGFDFIQPPLVELEAKSNDDEIVAKIKKFESRARIKGETKVSKLDALSMVMVDYDYNDKVFDLDKVFYADDLKANSWKIDLPRKDIKGKVMLVFLDIYGNESWVVIDQKSKSKTHGGKKK